LGGYIYKALLQLLNIFLIKGLRDDI